MTSISSANSVALLILQQTNVSFPPTRKDNAVGADLVATANGVAAQGTSGTGNPSMQAKANISEAFFSPNSPSVLEMKIHLMKRLGEELGVRFEDHESQSSFGAAIREVIGEIKMKPGGTLVIAELERRLGFDKLGFSLDTFVNAIIDPKGSDGQKVDAALKKHLGLDDTDDGKADERHVLQALRIDENGLYLF